MSPEEKAEWHRRREADLERRRVEASRARARETAPVDLTADPSTTLARKLAELQSVIDAAPDRATVVRAVEAYAKLSGLAQGRPEPSEREVDLGKLSDEELDALRRDVVRRLGGRVE